MREMLEKNKKTEENVMGFLITQVGLESNDYLNEEEKRRSDLVEQIKRGAFEKR